MNLPFKFPQMAPLLYDEERPASCEELVGRPYSTLGWVTRGVDNFFARIAPQKTTKFQLQ